MTDNIFKNITIEQFKEYFFRDFPYLPVWVEGKIYFTGDIVYFNQNFYKSLVDNNTATPNETEMWQATAGNVQDYVTDADITRAMSQAYINANYDFGSTDEERIMIYLHLIAFYLVMDWQNASMGVNNGYMGPITSKSVGDISETHGVYEWVQKSPQDSIYLTNGFGMKYLSLTLPYRSCTILFSRGRTTYG